MPPPWKHRTVSTAAWKSRWRTRDSHIPTADHRLVTRRRTEDWTASTRSGTLTARRTSGNSGGKGFEHPGSIPSENRHAWLYVVFGAGLFADCSRLDPGV